MTSSGKQTAQFQGEAWKAALSGEDPEGHDDPRLMLHRILKLNNRLIAPFNTHLESRYRISLNEFRVFMSLGRFGEAAAHELAESTGINSMGVSRALSVLRRQGRVEEEVDPANRRRKLLRLTADGQKLFEQMLPSSDRVAAYLFEALTPEDFGALSRILDALTERLEAVDAQGRSLFIEATRPEDEQQDA